MKGNMPPLRALQAFEAFGRLGSVNAAARELGVTPGAVSQQLKLLEEQVGVLLIVKDGRRAALTQAARAYHELVSQGFARLGLAQDWIVGHRQNDALTISGLPTLLQRWLNPIIHRFQGAAGETPIRIEATHNEPDPQLLNDMFRLTYGAAAERFPHARVLFTDSCFPVCAPDYLSRHPEAMDPARLARLPLIEIDWGPAYRTVPRWRDWFAAVGVPAPSPAQRPVAVYSVSGLALEAAAAGQGAVLAQASFVAADLASGRLVRLSADRLPMPEPYCICWGTAMLERASAREFLNWIAVEARRLRESNVQAS